ncbi:hypothetical protein Pf1_02552 [Flavobacterium columnare]|nr:hypothetical protein Pf1_02552 [Flavobacterium columnare]
MFFKNDALQQLDLLYKTFDSSVKWYLCEKNTIVMFEKKYSDGLR